MLRHPDITKIITIWWDQQAKLPPPRPDSADSLASPDRPASQHSPPAAAAAASDAAPMAPQSERRAAGAPAAPQLIGKEAYVEMIKRIQRGIDPNEYVEAEVLQSAEEDWMQARRNQMCNTPQTLWRALFLTRSAARRTPGATRRWTRSTS